MNGLKGRTAVITGAAGGIGFSIAKKLGSLGVNVAILDIDTQSIKKAAQELSELNNIKSIGIVCDVTDENSVKDAFTAIRNELGSIGILINNAGIISFEGLDETTLDQYHRTMNVNVLEPFLCTREAADEMKKNSYGKIVTIGSSAGLNGGAGKAGVYGASKAAAMTLTKSFARELAPYNINVNAVAPSLIATRMLTGIKDFTSLIPLGRTGTPEDVANSVAFLCSDEASFITGEILDVNGGFLID